MQIAKEAAHYGTTPLTLNMHEKNTTEQALTQCKCTDCTCGNIVVEPPHIVGYWPQAWALGSGVLR